jgi:protein tyrosine phosphatase
MNDLPFPRSYWVAPGKLLAGAYPGSSELSEAKGILAGLVAAGVTRVISSMEESEKIHSGKAVVDYTATIRQMAEERGQVIECLRYPFVDGSIPSTAIMTSVLNRIDEEIGAGGAVYVHCWGGKGRTGLVVCCWLIRHGIAAPEEAVDHLQILIKHNAAAFHPTPENSEQRDFVRNWKVGT